MSTPDRQRPALCIDCGHPISDRAIRCRPCAARARTGIEPVSTREPETDDSQVPALGPEDVAWLRANGRRYNAARLAQVFGLPVEHIRWILDTTGVE